ncbi:tripartite motif-containing protein 3-like [Argopecten irradians]|uniref:tripartite motif-containing protein 3-like n=1 Tax=Argopecten irradians TaxID=31199 RepID=UPI003722F03B
MEKITSKMEPSENSYVNELKERFLECPVCLEEFTQESRIPRVLPCLHTHCDTCLKAMMKDASVKCTLCQKSYAVPDENLCIFPTDYTRKDLQDFVHASLCRKDLICEGCTSKESAKFRCTTCAHFLCDACRGAHARLVVFQTHEVFSLEEERSSEENIRKYAHQRYCKTPGHDREIMYYYCKECNKSICTRCYLIPHKSHDVKDIQDVYDVKKIELQEESKRLHSRIAECNGIRAKVTQAKEEVESNQTKAREELNSAFETLIQLLTRRRDELLAKINAVASRKRDILLNQEQSLDKMINLIENCCGFLHQSLTYNNQPAFMDIAPIIAGRFSYLQALELDEEPHESSHLSFTGQNGGLTFGTFIQSLGAIESSAFYRPNTMVSAEPNAINSPGKIIIELQNHEGVRLDERLDIEATVFKDSETHTKTTLAHREGGAYEMILHGAGPYQMSLKAFGEKMFIWEGPVPKPSDGLATNHRIGPPTSTRQLRRTSETFSSSPPLGEHTTTIYDIDLRSGRQPERPPLPKVELLHQDRGDTNGEHSLPAHLSSSGQTKDRQRSLTRTAFHFDESTLHKSRFLSKDKKNLFNRKQTHLQSESVQDDKKPVTVRTRRDHKLQRYQGVTSSSQITLPEDVYFEVDITYQLEQTLADDVTIFEIGFTHDCVVDSSNTLGNDKQSCSVAAYASSNDGTLRLMFRENEKLVSSLGIQAKCTETGHVVSLGLNVDTQSQTVTVLDLNNANCLFRFDNRDNRAGIWPVFGVFNPQKVDVVLNLKTGSDIKHIPFHLLK